MCHALTSSALYASRQRGRRASHGARGTPYALDAALLSSADARGRAARQTLTSALRHSEAAAARGAEALALQEKVSALQDDLRQSYKACTEASAALLAARELSAAKDAKLARLTAEVASLRADLATARERIAELAAAVRVVVVLRVVWCSCGGADSAPNCAARKGARRRRRCQGRA